MMKKVLMVIGYLIAFLTCYALGAFLAKAHLVSQKLAAFKVTNTSTVLKDLSYGKQVSNRYDLYLPEAKKESYALILHIHGGGFVAGDKKEGRALSTYFASQGYVTASVNYSLMSKSSSSKISMSCIMS